MDELLNRAMRSTLFFVAACLLLWAAVPDYRPIAAGLILGAAASLVNAFLLKRRIELLGQMSMQSGRRPMGLGMASRLATVLLAVLIAMRFSEHFALPAVVAACFYVQFAIFFVGLLRHWKRSNGKG